MALAVTGIGGTSLTRTNQAKSPGRATGTVDFGSFSTLLHPAPANGSAFRVTTPAAGAVIVAQLSASVSFQGLPGVALTVARLHPVAGPGDIPLSDLRVASPMITAWNSGFQGTQVPSPGMTGFDICQAMGDLTCVSAKPYAHSLAVFLPDNRPAGPFGTTVVYSGTIP